MIAVSRHIGVLGVTCILAALLAGPVATNAQDTQETAAKQAVHCVSCGKELLPQSRAYSDRRGRPICGDCKKHAGEAEAFDLRTTDRLSGDWWGVRTDLEEAGIDIGLTLGSVWQDNFRGGANTHNAHETSGELFYEIEFNLETMFGLSGATFYIAAVQTWNDGISDDVGSLVAPYEGPGAAGDVEIAIDRYHYRQRLWDDRIEFRLGMLDGGDLFDENEYSNDAGGQFPSGVFENSTNIPLPKGIGAFVRAWPWDWMYVSAGVFDPETIETHNRRGTGGFDTAFHDAARAITFWEVGLLPQYYPGVTKLLSGHYRFGLWLDSTSKPIFINDLVGRRPERTRSGDVGWYFNMDQVVWKENDNADDDQGLGVFARYGFAHQDVNEINHYWSIGASYLGLIPSRDEDVTGFAVAQSIMSKQLRHNVDPSADRETVYDLYYKIILTPWCAITPDVQVITNPGGDKSARDALVGGVRVEINF